MRSSEPVPLRDVILNDFSCAVPLRAIDKVGVDDTGGELEIVAVKAIDSTDPYLAGHFPGLTVYPGVFLLETLRQALIIELGERYNFRPQIRTLRSARFLSPLFAGDELTLTARIGPISRLAPFEVDAIFRRADGGTVARLKVEFCHGGEDCA
jgi:3-hydroxyacyl-[acyl-carrier-protein] dehydratase